MAMKILFWALIVINAVVGISCYYTVIGVTVYTGDRMYAGTDAGVFMYLRGKNGVTSEYKLSNWENNHERGDIDHYTLSVYNFGTPTSLTIRHDNSGAGAGWYLDKVVITKSGNSYVFDCYRWLDKSAGLSATLYPKKCTYIPTAPRYGTWKTEPTPYIVHQTAVLQCNAGYVRSTIYDSQATITCQSSGSWSSTSAVCCPVIEHCKSSSQICSSTENTCTSCVENNVLYRLMYNGQRCEALCSYNSHYCWPGYCTDDLKASCACADDFKLISNTTMTSCQLTKLPSVETCRTTAIGETVQENTTTQNVTSTECPDLDDMYGNFQPSTVKSELLVELSVNVSSLIVPSFIHDSQLGVTDVLVKLTKKDINLNYVYSTTRHLLQDTTAGTRAQETFSKTTRTTLPSVGFHLSNGERLCIEYETKGGGYLKSQNPSGIISPSVPYTKTSASRGLCYIYDAAAPEHCSQRDACFTEPLYIAHRVTRSANILVQFLDWNDPTPIGGDTSGASGIESYQVTVHEVEMSSVPLQVKPNAILSQTLNSNISSTTLDLPTSGTQLHCIMLKVADKADNSRRARRFVLIDNTSSIEIDQSKEVIVESASPATQYTWQTNHGPICLIWKDYFYNRMHRDNNFLEQIEEDPNGLINDSYDQITGILPIAGTKHVNGIVKFEIIWGIDNVYKHTIANLIDQIFCLNTSLEDGESYNLTVKASDIADNVRAESRIVHIDSSEPDITDFSLVNDTIRFSEIQLQFEAYDSHSGIRTIEWSLGASNVSSEMSGSVSVQTFRKSSCPVGVMTCYCPNIGVCEVSRYVLTLSEMVPEWTRLKLNNETCIATLNVTNHAMLSHTETMTFVVEHTPVKAGNKLSFGLGIYVGIPAAAVGACLVGVTLLLVTRYVSKRKHRQPPESSDVYAEIQKERGTHVYASGRFQNSEIYENPGVRSINDLR